MEYGYMDDYLTPPVGDGSRWRRRRRRGARLRRGEDEAAERPLDPFLLSQFRPSVCTERGGKGGGKSGREFSFSFFPEF